MSKANWITPIRQAHLVKLFLESRGFCVFHHVKCQFPEHHYTIFSDNLVKDWQADDKNRKQAEWQAERITLHALGERKTPIRGTFNNISQDIILANQPLFYLEGIGVNGITFKPFAKIRLANSYMRLYVDLGHSLQTISKNRKRKAIRYGKILPLDVSRRIDSLCYLAVKHYLNY